MAAAELEIQNTNSAGTVFERKQQNKDRSLRPLSGNKQMSFHKWSRHEPVHTRNTEHWSKLRCKSYKLTQLPTGNTVSFCKPKETWVQGYARQKYGLPKSTTVTSKGTLAPVGCPEFNTYLQDRLHCPYLVKPRPPSDSRGYDKNKRVSSASSQRAKLPGYKYWQQDSKPSTPGQKVTMGAKGTFLGLGVPRL